MFIDVSAICAIMIKEDDAEILMDKIMAAATKLTSPMAVWEATLAVSRATGIATDETAHLVDEFLAAIVAEIIPITTEMTPLAIAAHRDYGKERHPAALNFGDCFAYAAARHHRLPLMFKGEDFIRTDIEPA
ncbi:ribonuclease VapC [Rhizobium sp. SG_E_25_P2]|uniref:type II toxin-antitoxin system VapC family toxin n=1 Tax=Rhizobium sp. SG_E_25_P2 TaxID=2879942 RepID=UPI0024735CF8|nr:type II toxin-antitoxin system VapC family toxin [Rhizobium sp. SG_E_25_P2]MDH6265213.1 ribonuclease VapC [Rhizobium sp. SG_E_25_P2]